MLKGKRYVLMEGNPGAAGAGAGGAAAGAAGATDGGTGDTGGAAAAATGANGAAGAGAAGSGSAMGAGAGAGEGGAGGSSAGAGEGANPWAFIPDKYQVRDAKGELDPQASARKVADAHAALEKRLGSGGTPPKTAAEYKMPELPEALKGAAFDDAATNKFKEDALKAGFTQAQFEFTMGEYLKMAPALVNGGQVVAAEDTIASLKQTWGADYEKNGQAAWRGMEQIAQAAGLTTAEVEAELGNSPAFNRIMAVVGAQLREDKSINTGGVTTGSGGESEAAAIQMSDAFRNPKDPGHKAALAKWHSIVTKGVADTPVL
jgi:hypothetical protein